MKESLFSRRNVPECMGTAWTLMSTNVARTVRTLWLPSVLTAVLCAAAAVLGIHMRTPESPACLAAGVFVCGALLVPVSLFLDSGVFTMLTSRGRAFCFVRAVKAFAVSLAAVLLAVLLVWGAAASDVLLASSGKLASSSALLLFAAETVVLLVLFLVFLTPVTYVLVRYMAEPEMRMKSFWKHYGTALRSGGFIAAFYLLTLVVLVISYLVTALPAVIATAALGVSDAGLAAGDAAGLPSYFGPMYAAVIFVTTFVAVVLRVWSVMAAYYMYASVEARNGRRDDEDEEREGGK